MVPFAAVVSAMFPQGINHGDKDKFNTVADTYGVMMQLHTLNAANQSTEPIRVQFDPSEDWLRIQELAQRMNRKPYQMQREAPQLVAAGQLEVKEVATGKAGRKQKLYRLKPQN